MNNQNIIIKLTATFFLCFFINTVITQAQPQDYVDITMGNGYGLRFWDGNDAFKISMGQSSTYQYGPVSTISIKTNMHPAPGRGWTWGSWGNTPVTALSNTGEFQTEGYIKSMKLQFLFGDNQSLQANDDNLLRYYSNNSSNSMIGLYDKEFEPYGFINGYDNVANGNGATAFGLCDADGNWSYLAAKGDYTSFKINNIEMMRIEDNGNVGIGTNNPEHKLDVCGTARFADVIVEDDWCDFVFEPEYCLTTLEEEADFIKLYGHLSNFESAKDMNGEINVNDIFKRQQIQIEENVLHLIDLNEENKVLQFQVNDLTDEVENLNNQVTTLTANYEILTKELATIKAQLK